MVTHGPLHRSGRAALPHPAPALGHGAQALLPDAPAPARWTRPPGSASGAYCTRASSPWPAPFPPPPPRPAARLCSAASQVSAGPPGSRAECFRPCVGSQAARGPVASCDGDATDVAFRFQSERRHLDPSHQFRGSMASRGLPLSTLHRRPYGRQRMTRGRSGSLLLLRMALASTTSRCGSRARSESPLRSVTTASPIPAHHTSPARSHPRPHRASRPARVGHRLARG